MAKTYAEQVKSLISGEAWKGYAVSLAAAADRVLAEKDAEIARLRRMLEALLEMPSCCNTDEEVIRNNERRQEARAALSPKGPDSNG